MCDEAGTGEIGKGSYGADLRKPLDLTCLG